MFSFKVAVIVLIIVMTISTSIEVIGDSDDFKKHGRINLFYVVACLAVSAITLVVVMYLIIFIKSVWVWCLV